MWSVGGDAGGFFGALLLGVGARELFFERFFRIWSAWALFWVLLPDLERVGSFSSVSAWLETIISIAYQNKKGFSHQVTLIRKSFFLLTLHNCRIFIFLFRYASQKW